uniref:Uncharacterized protein n=1 Tax=Nelumbo nucifera TaxID=4432 RepID=A0A822YZ56_NELNU|nr:TPA_asm: hypothetical protein HUJ06_008164 [Nelumbo nucifera]
MRPYLSGARMNRGSLLRTCRDFQSYKLVKTALPVNAHPALCFLAGKQQEKT